MDAVQPMNFVYGVNQDIAGAVRSRRNPLARFGLVVAAFTVR